MIHRRVTLLALVCFACSCGGDGAEPAGETCSRQGQVSYVRDALQDWYYWYRELPEFGPILRFSPSPEDYLEAVRYRPLDTSYSYITSKTSSDAFYSDGQMIGFGLSYRFSSETEIRITQTFPDGPAAEVGIDRGDYLLAIDDVPIAELLRTGTLYDAFGPEEVGYAARLTWRGIDGAERAATLAKRTVTIPTVSHTALLEVGDSRVGYVHLRNFVQPSVAALDAAFGALRDRGATDLVLDLRYNGGGLVSVAQHLASLVTGQASAGGVFVRLAHNDKRTDYDRLLELESPPQALGVKRLVVITTGATASASEAVVNGLRPYIDVRTVGDTSYGKPVGQYGFEFCDKVLYPVAFLVTNARGEADYFDGIPADCAAGDDLAHPLASAEEASLAEALHLVRYGRCSATAAATADLHARRRTGAQPPRLDGWRETLNAW
jgi:carboxyl-terminal processing protease